MTRRLFLVACLALATAPSAWAHASLVRTVPSDRAVLARAPHAVLVEFDDNVRVGPRNAAIRNDGLDILRGRPRIESGKTLVVPVKPRLGDGDYTVRWSIVSDDGHEEEGVIAFAVGKGRTAPAAALTARGIVTWQRVLMRTLFFLGILGAAGIAFFAVAVLRPLGVEAALLRPQAHLLFLGFLLAFLGSDSLVHTASAGGTRFERVVQVAATLAASGGAAAALTPLYPRLRYVAWACAALLFLCPTLSGHALDPDQPAVLTPLDDLLHLGAAGVWLGGLASLAVVVARAEPAVRVRAARRFSTIALGSVAVVAITGLGRAVTELSAVHQVWSTAYGRMLIVKTALFLPVLGLGWLNRAALLGVFERLRRSVLVELTLVTGILVAVGALTDERPGRVQAAVATAGATTPPSAAARPRPPTPGAYVDAGEAGANAVAIAVENGFETVTVIGPDGTGVDGVRVLVDGFRGRPCGAGCYRARAIATPTTVRVGRYTLQFPIPLRLHDGSALLQRATKAFTSARSVEYSERVVSGPGDVLEATFVLQAPDRLEYHIRDGPDAIVIGSRRWDRSPGGTWIRSPQTPLREPAPYWHSSSRNALLIAPHVLTFYDPSIPAWFRLRVAPRTARPVELHMTAAAHFMTHRYSSFDRPVDISPPSR